MVKHILLIILLMFTVSCEDEAEDVNSRTPFQGTGSGTTPTISSFTYTGQITLTADNTKPTPDSETKCPQGQFVIAHDYELPDTESYQLLLSSSTFPIELDPLKGPEVNPRPIFKTKNYIYTFADSSGLAGSITPNGLCETGSYNNQVVVSLKQIPETFGSESSITGEFSVSILCTDSTKKTLCAGTLTAEKD